MSDDLDSLREKIANYADYADRDARHHVDKQIRALLGEALAAARTRLGPSGPVAEQLDGLLLRCEFSDQRVIAAADRARFDDALAQRVHALDRAIVDCATAIRGVAGVDELPPMLDEAARLFDQRFGVLSDAPASP